MGNYFWQASAGFFNSQGKPQCVCVCLCVIICNYSGSLFTEFVLWTKFRSSCCEAAAAVKTVWVGGWVLHMSCRLRPLIQTPVSVFACLSACLPVALAVSPSPCPFLLPLWMIYQFQAMCVKQRERDCEAGHAQHTWWVFLSHADLHADKLSFGIIYLCAKKLYKVNWRVRGLAEPGVYMTSQIAGFLNCVADGAFFVFLFFFFKSM